MKDAPSPAPQPHPATLDEQQLLASCAARRLRRGGPGGQHRNKVETAVVITHEPTGVRAEANERRGQAENRAVAIFRLRVNLALEVRSREPPQECPSRLWRSRCTGIGSTGIGSTGAGSTGAGRISIAAGHWDFPAMLAEALDVLGRCEDDPKPASEALGCTVSQLLKLLKKEPRAMIRLNQRRLERGLRVLK